MVNIKKLSAMANPVKQPLLAREGWVHIAIALIVALVVQGGFGTVVALPFWAILVFVLQFFRDPSRLIPNDDKAIVSPADGKIIYLGRAVDPYLNRPALKLSVFMNVFSVHSNRSPVSGMVMDRWYSQGKFFNAALDKASEHNERNALWVKTKNGSDVVFIQVAGLIARRILSYVDKGDEISRGQRYGFIRFGSRVDIYLPENVQLDAKLGDWVSAGSDIIGYLND